MANLVTTEANNLLNATSGVFFTVASVTTTASSASATVSSGGFPNVVSGMLVSSTALPSGAQVQSVSGNTLTLVSGTNVTAGTTTFTFYNSVPVGAVKVALDTANGTVTAAGTEVSGGSYARQTLTMAASSSGSASSSAALTYTSMPACTVTGVDEFDSATTPNRRWTGALAASKTVNSGDTFSIASGSYTKTLS